MPQPCRVLIVCLLDSMAVPLQQFRPGTPQGATGWGCFPGPVYPNGSDPECRTGGNCSKALGGCLFELVSEYGSPDIAASREHAFRS